MSLTEKLTRPLKVSRKIQETKDACSLVLSIPQENRHEFVYRPGQFVTLFLQIGGEELRRSYSLCTSPFTDTEFKITIKKVPGGRGSTFLVDTVKEGDELRVTPPSGHFFSPPKTVGGTHYILVGAGSGITPLFSILKSVLFANEKNRVSLLYANRSHDQVIYREELLKLQNKYGERLNVVHLTSQPDGITPGLHGRLSTESFSAFCDQCLRGSSLAREAYLCGPEGFMKTAKELLLSQNLMTDQIHMESFGENLPHSSPSAIDLAGVAGQTVIGPDPAKPGELPTKLVALLNGEEIEITPKEGQSILETLLEAGYSAPYSCMDGACMACLAKVRTGTVAQKDPGILTEDNIAACETLTCQARCLSSTVKIDYDNL